MDVGFRDNVAEGDRCVDEELCELRRTCGACYVGSDAVPVRVICVCDDRSIGLLHSNEAVLEIPDDFDKQEGVVMESRPLKLLDSAHSKG